MNDAVGWDVDDLDELGAGELESSARGTISGVAGDPEWVETELVREREHQAYGSGGRVMSAMWWENAVADVSSVELNVRR